MEKWPCGAVLQGLREQAALLSSGQLSEGPTAKAGVSFLPGGPAQRPPGLFLALSLTIGRYAVVLYDVIIINLAI